MSISISVSGPVKKRSVTETEKSETVEIQTVYITHTETFVDPKDFHTVAVKQTPKRVAASILPEENYITPETKSNWEVNISANASEITKFAEEISNETDTTSLEILLIWLQNLGSQRIRRAIQTQLNTEHAIDIDPDAF